MAGSQMGSLKKKLGLKGKTKTGEMIGAMNKIKKSGLKKQMVEGAA